MKDLKYETLLSMSIQATEQEREQSQVLGVGVLEKEKIFEVIIKHSGDISFLQEELPGTKIIQLLAGYAVGEIAEEYVYRLSEYSQIEYVEKPKLFYFQDYSSFMLSCIPRVKVGSKGLTGKGVITAIIDSGINILLPDFRDSQGNSRILALWDQQAMGAGTQWHPLGREYDKTEIDMAISSGKQLAMDLANHGTAVSAIASGRDGVANDSAIVFVKLLPSRQGGFPRTTQIMLAIDYVIRKAEVYHMPVVINLSLGNNYGSHLGNTILEQYLEDVKLYWKATICAGAGNEGLNRNHAGGKLEHNRVERIGFTVGAYQKGFGIQIWSNYADSFEIRMITPNGILLGSLSEYGKLMKFQIGNMQVLGYQGGPLPYSIFQEAYLDFVPTEYVMPGTWHIELVPKKIVEGGYNLWLPEGAALNEGTGFLVPDAQLTVTIPGTAQGIITVGAYDGKNDSYAPFSGRGGEGKRKPELVAPGVGILAPGANGLIEEFTGTSFATPIVSGCCALLMEWGIVQKNDLELYGERIKAYLLRGARQLPGEVTPSIRTGYGAVCLFDSFPQN